MSLNLKICEQTNNLNNTCINNANNLFNYCTAVIENSKIDSLTFSSLNSTIQQTCFSPTLTNDLTTMSLTNNNSNINNNNNNTKCLYSTSLNQSSNVSNDEKPLLNENLILWHSNKDHHNRNQSKLIPSINSKKTTLKGYYNKL